MHTYIVRVFVKVQKLFKMDPQQHISLVIFALMAKVNSFKFKDIGWEHANVIVVEDDGGVCDVYFFSFSPKNDIFGFRNVNRHFITTEPVCEFLKFNINESN